MVYYRKYRPQKISDLDSTAVREKLLSVFSKGDSIPHAFLFTGPKGLGKTSTARIVAKTVNCERVPRVSRVPQVSREEEEKKEKEKARDTRDTRGTRGTFENIEPCNTCDQCISITNGTSLDVLEIDAASNRGIDEIRDLKEKIRLAPVSSRKKVYIIDEVHMLTTEAFNALLKTLEEPPDHAMFVLCTTEPHKVLGTIISRCFHIHFNLATEDEIVHSLKRIVDGENLQADEEALRTLALMADGGFRDAAKTLEEVSLLAGDQKITEALIEEKYKIASVSISVVGLLEALQEKNTKKSLQLIQQVVGQGIDIKYFIDQLMRKLHVLLLIYVNGEAKDSLLTLEEIRALVKLFSKAYTEMKYAVLPQLPLELAVIEYTTAASASLDAVIPSDHRESRNLTPKMSKSSTVVGDPSASLGPSALRSSLRLEEMTDGGIGMTNGGIGMNASDAASQEQEEEVTVSTLRKKVGEIQKNNALYGEPKVAKNDKPTIETVSVDLMKVPADGTVTKEWQEALWRSIISEMKQYNHTIAGVLRSCAVRSYDKEQLIIETAYKFHKERLDDMKTQEALIKVCKILTGNAIKIAVELKDTN